MIWDDIFEKAAKQQIRDNISFYGGDPLPYFAQLHKMNETQSFEQFKALAGQKIGKNSTSLASVVGYDFFEDEMRPYGIQHFEPTLEPVLREYLANHYRPFCHGTNDWSADEALRRGLKPRGDRPTMYPDAPSFTDRVYVGCTSGAGLDACLSAAKNAYREGGGAPVLLFLSPAIALKDVVADEDCQTTKLDRSALDSADYCMTFAVRGSIEPSLITDVIELDHPDAAEKICKVLIGDGWLPEEIEECRIEIQQKLDELE